MIKEVGRIIISLCLLGAAVFLLYFGLQSPEPAQALGIGVISGGVLGSLTTYWLKPG